MWQYWPVVPGALFVAGLLAFERKDFLKGKLATKLPASSLFVVTALIQPHPVPSYFYAMLAGLVLSLFGDLFLALPQKKAFMMGLVAFLLGHVAYIVAFVMITSVGVWTIPGAIAVLALSAGVYLWLRPNLGSMNVPVLAYVIVISIMVTAAWSVFIETEHPLWARILVLAGAFLFYLSDVTVARDRFVRQGFDNRLVGLPMYYAGQFLLAYSVGLVA